MKSLWRGSEGQEERPRRTLHSVGAARSARSRPAKRKGSRPRAREVRRELCLPCARAHALTHVHAHTCAHALLIYTLTHAHVLTHTCTHAHLHTLLHTRTCAHALLMCTHTHVRGLTHMCTTLSCTRARAHTYSTHADAPSPVRTRSHTCTLSCTVHALSHAHTRAYSLSYTCVCTCMHTHFHTCTHACAHTHTHACTLFLTSHALLGSVATRGRFKRTEVPTGTASASFRLIWGSLSTPWPECRQRSRGAVRRRGAGGGRVTSAGTLQLASPARLRIVWNENGTRAAFAEEHLTDYEMRQSPPTKPRSLIGPHAGF